ncbi:bifunctional [glutamine synthetase] adenylyltransferase/[glutamine synthetase]-adenylyl-L-tyrosine phosphorylase [Brooklawnia cerclae]|uniref:Glutamate-ammonia-ligase adenylyltransferase n=1 Tax=Brooklawnia cerclae TaxID=349934 RepID=A0ABX0SKR1_9ACTN|nr:bifunctional [glutamine synthetase] adenylyltransferase/[glutamine synthetase]-adenylyl-L-tyrosine phosphorylase [Brooklawnia cerclae]NIH57630.1 glutamate-ammonia-ligase adenylyltransferase [Brooklawnia cerclae]
MSDRTSTPVGDLARRGFTDVVRAAGLVDFVQEYHPSGPGRDWLALVADAADPDLALQGLATIHESAPALMAEVFASRGWLGRVVAVLGGSRALNEYARVHPDDLRVLSDEQIDGQGRDVAHRVGAVLGVPDGPDGLVLDDPEAADLLRRANRRELLRIAARDLSHPQPASVVDRVAGELTELADAVMGYALAIARGQVPGAATARLAIVALGKCGARELNYLSDVDVLYVAEPASPDVTVEAALHVAEKVAAASARVCSAHTTAGTIWQVDAALRPDGKHGPLVRTLASHRSYYEKWAKNWEFQAMLKARPMAGDQELGQAFCDMVSPLVWQVGGQPNFMSDTQAMRQRVVSLIPAKERDREIKLGAGGLRDVEFSVQLLQLVHGRVDERLRIPTTLPALDALVAHGYIGRADGARLGEAYRFERVLEHREQLFRLRRTHLMPDDPGDLDRLARQVGQDSGSELWDAWRRVTREVQRLQQRVFYSPLLEAVSRLTSDELRMSPDAAADRLRALGFSDPGAALRHIGALGSGLSRTAEIQRQLMPAMLQWLSEGPNPDLGLLSFRRLSDEMGSTTWYIRALRDEGWMAERLARILSASRYIGDLLRRDPSVVQMLGRDDELVPRTRADLAESMANVVERHEDDPGRAVTAIRELRRRELFRLAAGDVLGTIDLDSLGRGLSDLAGATIDAALAVARGTEEAAGVHVPGIGVVAMGRWGGAEMSYASDADAMFVVPDDAGPEGIQVAERVLARVRDTLGAAGPEPPLWIDADLRPEGRSGPLVRTLGSHVAYYRSWSDTWESQALLRASFGAGDEELVTGLLDRLAFRRYPPGGVSAAQVAEIRRLKGRMEHERMGPERTRRNLKLGRGGLSDVEWTVQLLQLRMAGTVPALRCTGTMVALAAAQDEGLIGADDADALRCAWRLASQLRNKTMLVRGRASDQLPSDTRETASVAMLLGYEPAHASSLQDDWAKAARHAGQVVDRLFWGSR